MSFRPEGQRSLALSPEGLPSRSGGIAAQSLGRATTHAGNRGCLITPCARALAINTFFSRANSSPTPGRQYRYAAYVIASAASHDDPATFSLAAAPIRRNSSRFFVNSTTVATNSSFVLAIRPVIPGNTRCFGPPSLVTTAATLDAAAS